MKVLDQFHIDNAEEYRNVLKEFNILFFGYGCKHKMLTKLFPRTKVINCYNMETYSIAETIKLHIIKTLKPKNPSVYTLMDANTFFNHMSKIIKRSDEILLILLNFRKDLTFLMNSNIRIVGTIEGVNIEMSYEDVYDYNFIFRDLTTYNAYTEEIMDINLDTEIKKVLVVENLMSSVSKKAANIFIETLKIFDVGVKIPFSELVKKVGKKFLITTITSIKNHLHEFIDHKVLKATKDGNLVIELSKSDVDKILLFDKKE